MAGKYQNVNFANLAKKTTGEVGGGGGGQMLSSDSLQNIWVDNIN